MVTVTKGHQALTASLIALPLAHSSLTRQDCDCSLLQMGKRRQGGSGDFLRSQSQWAGRRAGLMPPPPPSPRAVAAVCTPPGWAVAPSRALRSAFLVETVRACLPGTALQSSVKLASGDRNAVFSFFSDELLNFSISPWVEMDGQGRCTVSRGFPGFPGHI